MDNTQINNIASHVRLSQILVTGSRTNKGYFVLFQRFHALFWLRLFVFIMAYSLAGMGYSSLVAFESANTHAFTCNFIEFAQTHESCRENDNVVMAI